MKTSKKYMIGTGIAAAVLAIGGTVAFFTSTDSIENIFTTGATDGDNENAGIDVQEDFRVLAAQESYKHPSFGSSFVNTNPSRGFEEYDDDTDGNDYGELIKSPSKVLPGELFIKAMHVQSEVNYDQYLRVQAVVTITMKDAMPVVVQLPTDLQGLIDDGLLTVVGGSPIINYMGLIIELDPSVLTEWTGDGGYFYYDFILGPGATTKNIVKSVVIDPMAGNEWQDATFDITLNADSIQATTDAWSSWTSLAVPTVVDTD